MRGLSPRRSGLISGHGRTRLAIGSVRSYGSAVSRAGGAAPGARHVPCDGSEGFGELAGRRGRADRRQRPGEHPFGVHVDVPSFVRRFGCGVLREVHLGCTTTDPRNGRNTECIVGRPAPAHEAVTAYLAQLVRPESARGLVCRRRVGRPIVGHQQQVRCRADNGASIAGALQANSSP
jgi:hypothetical protein